MGNCRLLVRGLAARFESTRGYGTSWNSESSSNLAPIDWQLSLVALQRLGDIRRKGVDHLLRPGRGTASIGSGPADCCRGT